MLVQDTLGYVHEVPDNPVYGAYVGEFPDQIGEGQVIYDGFGNPVGLPFLAPLAAKALPILASRLVPAAARALPGIVRGVQGAIRRFAPVARAVQRAMPRAIQQFAPVAQAFQQSVPGAIQQFAPVAQAFQQPPPGAMQQPMPAPSGEDEFAEVPYQLPMAPLTPYQRPPFPPGWIPRPSPYTGLQPRRLYMRCLTWRGPGGLVPAQAAQTAPGALVPPATAAARRIRRIRRNVRRRR
jgi:hypothetical protein